MAQAARESAVRESAVRESDALPFMIDPTLWELDATDPDQFEVAARAFGVPPQARINRHAEVVGIGTRYALMLMLVGLAVLVVIGLVIVVLYAIQVIVSLVSAALLIGLVLGALNS